VPFFARGDVPATGCDDRAPGKRPAAVWSAPKTEQPAAMGETAEPALRAIVYGLSCERQKAHAPNTIVLGRPQSSSTLTVSRTSVSRPASTRC